MNAKERFMAALHGAPVDRPPVAGVVTAITVHMMEAVGVRWPEAHGDAGQLSRLAAAAWEVGRLECIKLPFDMSVELEALGGRVDFGSLDISPQDAGHVYDEPVPALPLGHFLDRGRVPVILNAISALRRRYDGEVAVVSSIVGPFTLAAKLFGFDNLFGWIALAPEKVETCLAAVAPLCLHYAQAQLAAGADAILIGEAACSGDLISWRVYRGLIAPRHRDLCAALAGPAILHICGKTTRHLPFIAETGVAAFSFDEKLDIAEARRHLKGRVALTGWVPTVDPLLNGAPESVYGWATRCLAEGADILNAGCSLPPRVPPANLAALVQAAHDWRG